MNAPLKAKPKHFLDLSDHDSATLKAIIADAKVRKLARGLAPKGMPDIPPEYLAMAAATMHAMGKFNKPTEETDARPNT